MSSFLFSVNPGHLNHTTVRLLSHWSGTLEEKTRKHWDHCSQPHHHVQDVWLLQFQYRRIVESQGLVTVGEVLLCVSPYCDVTPLPLSVVSILSGLVRSDDDISPSLCAFVFSLNFNFLLFIRRCLMCSYLSSALPSLIRPGVLYGSHLPAHHHPWFGVSGDIRQLKTKQVHNDKTLLGYNSHTMNTNRNL